MHRFLVVCMVLSSLCFVSQSQAFASTGVAPAGVEGGSSDNIITSFLDKVEEISQNSKLQDLREQALQKGFMINPWFKFLFEYTSNVFSEDTADKEDLIWTYTPGVDITYTQEKYQVGISYSAAFRDFTKYDIDDEVDQNFSAFADVALTDTLAWRVSEELIQQGAVGGSRSGEPLNFTDNTVDTSLVKTWGDLNQELGYQHFTREYASDGSDRFSYSAHKMYLRSVYQINEGLKAKGGYELNFTDYDESSAPNSVSHEFPVGLEGTLPMDIHYDATVSVYIRNQTQDFRGDFWTFLADVSLRKQLTKTTGLQVGFRRRPEEATFDDQPFYDGKTFYANLTQAISPKIRARGSISFTNRDYEGASTVGTVFVKRDDNIWGFGIGADYALRKWMILNLDYKYTERGSNIDEFSYSENRLAFGMTIPV